ncbi:ABC transporter ATP-binding protein [Bacillus sp. HMF5848]|uniref:ABC transporter ATP-binding protein n=1 Tax=Bacillus sp. HMF5848 TaxID=2495421 RepID=UPI000F7AE876|nr:ABC transporter ATP-binding protein [Bacillus sp. HMF5848]RSK26103.1 ABC transporter ATP-binding protein [Bacillus sp. HMF5848]
MCVLKAINLIKVYEGTNETASTKALNSLSLKVNRGEFIAIMGPSGSGKTTLLNILNGIDRPTSGWVKISDKKLSDMNRDQLAQFRRKNLGFVFQEFNLLPSLTLKENIMLPLIMDGRPVDEMEKKVKDIMATFDIERIANKYPYNVSGGQQQRTAVSRAIVNDPHIVFADEPTGNLDSKSARDVMNCLSKMNNERDSTIVVVTHDAFTASYCNKVIFIKDGQIHMELIRKGDRREFFDSILDCLTVLGGERNDI